MEIQFDSNLDFQKEAITAGDLAGGYSVLVAEVPCKRSEKGPRS